MPRVSAASLDPSPYERTLVLRGQRYRFRELTIGEYDELVALATTTKPSDFGTDIDVSDDKLLLRLMVLKSCVEPGFTDAQFAKLSMPVALKINSVVNTMHYGNLAEDKIEGEDDEEEEQGKD